MNLRKITKKRKWELSERDISVVQLLSKGCSALDISKKGGISDRTVEMIVSELRREYRCKNVTHLVATFLRKELIQ